MKKLKKSLFIIFILSFVITLTTYASDETSFTSLSTLQAPQNVNLTSTSADYDPDNVISFQNYATNGEVKITIDEDKVGTNYTLSYQFISLEDSTFNTIKTSMEELNSKGKEYLEDLNTKKEALDLQKDEVQKAREAYEAALESAPDAPETEKLKEAYETLQKEYNDSVTTYNDLVKQYQADLDKREEAIYALYPNYVESNWIVAENNIAKYTGTLTGTEHFLVWVKLDQTSRTAPNTIYDRAIYTFESQTKPEEPDIPANTTNTTDPTNTSSNTPNVDPTLPNKILPAAGSTITIFFVIIALIAIAIYGYKKYHTIDK